MFFTKGVNYFGSWEDPFVEKSLFDSLGKWVDGIAGWEWWSSNGGFHC